MVIDENEEWYDGFASWEEVRTLLRSDEWTALRDERQRLEVRHGGDGLIVYEWCSERMRARHRRGLHKLGFRAAAYNPVTLWEWDVAPALAATEQSEHDEMLEHFSRWARPESVAAARRRLVGDDLTVEQVGRVIQEVFRSEARDLAVAVYREPNYWDDEYDEDVERWPLQSWRGSSASRR